MSDNTEDILGKIEQAHMRGEHTLGAFAGCSMCRPVELGVSGAVDAPSMLEELARNAAQAEGIETAGQLYEIPIHKAAPAAGEGSLGDIALQDAQQALDDLETLGRAGIVVPNAEQAVAHGLVGVVRALVGIGEALQSLLTVVGDASEKYVDRPEPLPPTFEQARAALAERRLRDGLGPVDDDLPPAA